MRFNMEGTVLMYQTLMIRKMLFRHTTTMSLINMITMINMEFFYIVNGNLSQMICKFLKYQVIIMGLMV